MVKDKTIHLNSIKDRLKKEKTPRTEKVAREVFVELVKKNKNNKNIHALSVSVGNGTWDYILFKNNKKVKSITATDIVDNPVNKSDSSFLNTFGKWKFVKVKPEEKLPFEDNNFELIFHQDVIEHVDKPYLFLSEQYRVLKKDGELIFGTPNLFRPVNVIKLLINRLNFPIIIGRNVEIGDYIHKQEFYEEQLKILIEECGFKIIEIKNCFFGFHPLNIMLAEVGDSKFQKRFCHYLMIRCVK